MEVEERGAEWSVDFPLAGWRWRRYAAPSIHCHRDHLTSPFLPAIPGDTPAYRWGHLTQHLTHLLGSQDVNSSRDNPSLDSCWGCLASLLSGYGRHELLPGL
jgi:hypothetical protein